MAPKSFYLQSGDSWQATELTRGPWHRDYQHGGPVAALLGRALEHAVGPQRRIARIVIELYKPAPLARFELSVEAVREGRSVTRAEARLEHEGRPIARAAALAITHTALDFEPAVPGAAPPAPDTCPVLELPFFFEPVGYHTAMDLRLAAGEYGTGQVTAWMRAKVPLVEGEPLSPLLRVLLAADSGNGVSARLDTSRFSFVNPELIVCLHRPAQGEWVALEAETSVQPDGIGLADTRLHDALGPIGRATQPLVIARR